MQYDTTKYKLRENYKRVNQNEIEINNLINTSLKVTTINFQNNIYTYETEWTDWRNASSDNEDYTSVLKLQNFPSEYIPFIESQLLLKTIENDDGVVNETYIDNDFNDWEYSYVVRKYPFNEDSEDNVDYYLISRIYLDITSSAPFYYKEIISIALPLQYEVRNNKQ